MESIIYNPLEEYDKKFKQTHFDKTNEYFDTLVRKSGINIDENRETVKQYNFYKENIKKLKRKRNWLRFFRVLMIITLILIPIVIWKMTPKIRQLKQEIETASDKADELLRKAYEQMAPLNKLFSEKDCLELIEKTVPLMKFEDHFTSEHELDMVTNYDFGESLDTTQSTLDVLSGRYNENPFLFEDKLIRTMGLETYHGYKTIYWTETYRDSEGRTRTRTRSQTLHATVTKPKPFYTTQVVLNYGSQGAAELSFSRDASNLHKKSEGQIERHIKRGEKKLKRMTDKAIKKNDDFTSMSNTDFEVLFDALDRTNEVQFRTLFTPLAQTNMVDLILSKTGYGDDFNFYKLNRMNKIVTNHSQGRVIKLLPAHYVSYSFDIIKENFIGKNTEFFKAVYFDFAPLLAIPVYRERPVHSLKPIPDLSRIYSQKECETLANLIKKENVVHPNTKTQAIIKSQYVRTEANTDETAVTAYSFDIFKRIDVVAMLGGDGRMHNVSVPWDEYVPLEYYTSFGVSSEAYTQNRNVLARHNGLCIFS